MPRILDASTSRASQGGSGPDRRSTQARRLIRKKHVGGRKWPFTADAVAAVPFSRERACLVLKGIAYAITGQWADKHVATVAGVEGASRQRREENPSCRPLRETTSAKRTPPSRPRGEIDGREEGRYEEFSANEPTQATERAYGSYSGSSSKINDLADHDACEEMQSLFHTNGDSIEHRRKHHPKRDQIAKGTSGVRFSRWEPLRRRSCRGFPVRGGFAVGGAEADLSGADHRVQLVLQLSLTGSRVRVRLLGNRLAMSLEPQAQRDDVVDLKFLKVVAGASPYFRLHSRFSDAARRIGPVRKWRNNHRLGQLRV